MADNEFFLGMGVNLLEGFGLSETSPVVSVNLHKQIKPGTVGPPLKDTELRISPEGELEIRGPQVMSGYYKNKKATKDVFTADGWLRTGDLASLDEDNFLKITGRIKDIIITAGGKNISPQKIENSMKTSPYIGQVCIVGDRLPYLAALIVPDFEELRPWALRQGISLPDDKALINEKKVQQLIRNELDHHTECYGKVEKIRRFHLLADEWTQDTGELTPTQKVKRQVIVDRYGELIEKMYS